MNEWKKNKNESKRVIESEYEIRVCGCDFEHSAQLVLTILPLLHLLPSLGRQFLSTLDIAKSGQSGVNDDAVECTFILSIICQWEPWREECRLAKAEPVHCCHRLLLSLSLAISCPETQQPFGPTICRAVVVTVDLLGTGWTVLSFAMLCFLVVSIHWKCNVHQEKAVSPKQTTMFSGKIV